MMRQTYRQEWPAYNQAQTNEKARLQELLFELCSGIEEPQQTNGRPRLPLGEMVFCAVLKVYSTFSSRRFISDLHAARERGYVSKVPHFNSVSNYLESEALTPYLRMLIEDSAAPLRIVERDFAVDSSGFSTGIYQKWVDAKWGKVRQSYGVERTQNLKTQDWVKVHVMCGVKTNIITAVEVTHAHAHDSPQYPALLETTSRNFVMNSVCADKAYSSEKNLRLTLVKGAQPFIAFKSNATAAPQRNTVWKEMLRQYQYNQEWFMQHYHRRSNVETTFSMIKLKFGERLRSKGRTAQINEVLCKILCHNLCCLIQSIYELGIEPTFWGD